MACEPVQCSSKCGLLIAIVFFHALFGLAQSKSTAQTVIRQDRRVLLRTKYDQMQLSVCGGGSIVHVRSFPNGDTHGSDVGASPWIVSSCDNANVSFAKTAKAAKIVTASLVIQISLPEGQIEFQDTNGRMLLGESGEGSRSYEAITASVAHAPLYRVGDRFQLPLPATLYGLGQHASGSFNYSGSSVTLAQYNGDIGIPLAVSASGYGLLWNSAARTDFNNQVPSHLDITQDAGQGIDFYFLYGPELDQVIHLYRSLTGRVPMFPEWALGFIQSKNRYKTQDELVRTVEEYRQRQIPLDAIVQDYYWWTARGSNKFSSEYPDIEEALWSIHQQHAHALISIWPNFDVKTNLYREMAQRHLLIPGSDVYDATNGQAQALYWRELPSTLLEKGFDGLWLDASEPEIGPGKEGLRSGISVAAGPGILQRNAFPFFHTLGVSQHWREQQGDKRVFLLTRSAFIGQQANGAAIWSGDIETTFDSLRRQIPAGLNLMLSGIPYWTTDIGGYSYPDGNPADPQYRELFVRWFEYGIFCPLFRVHGRRVGNANELWSYGDALPILIKFDRLRYALLPYIYSLAHRVTLDDYTIMRPLIMDWREDPKVRAIADSYMFGPSLLINPITQQGTTGRAVYLPAATAWYDFWTGERVRGEQTVQAPAPLDRIPIYVRAGSIVPFGPKIQYAGENADGPFELRIYTGADAKFDLYSDQGDGYEYEHGASATIPITWNDGNKTLTIGRRIGEFPGMAKQETFTLVWVSPNHGTGAENTEKPDETVQYVGQPLTVTHEQN